MRSRVLNQDGEFSMDSIIWINGRFLPLGKARISPLDRGFWYGDGLFETIRIEKGIPLYLEGHIIRLYEGLKFLRVDLSELVQGKGLVFWQKIIDELVSKNNLRNTTALLKIIVSRGEDSRLGFPKPTIPTVIVYIKAYQAPEEATYEKGWRLSIVRSGYPSTLARFKTLNYLYFLYARQCALDAGADEAVVLDPLGYVTETATGSLLVRIGGQWIWPKGGCQLPGTSIGALKEILNKDEIFIIHDSLKEEELLRADTIWILNSLVGIMPACEVEGRRLPNVGSEEARHYRKLLFKYGMRE